MVACSASNGIHKIQHNTWGFEGAFEFANVPEKD